MPLASRRSVVVTARPDDHRFQRSRGQSGARHPGRRGRGAGCDPCHRDAAADRPSRGARAPAVHHRGGVPAHPDRGHRAARALHELHREPTGDGADVRGHPSVGDRWNRGAATGDPPADARRELTRRFLESATGRSSRTDFPTACRCCTRPATPNRSSTMSARLTRSGPIVVAAMTWSASGVGDAVGDGFAADVMWPSCAGSRRPADAADQDGESASRNQPPPDSPPPSPRPRAGIADTGHPRAATARGGVTATSTRAGAGRATTAGERSRCTDTPSHVPAGWRSRRRNPTFPAERSKACRAGRGSDADGATPG